MRANKTIINISYETIYNLFFTLFQWYIFFGMNILFNLFDMKMYSRGIT